MIRNIIGVLGLLVLACGVGIAAELPLKEKPLDSKVKRSKRFGPVKISSLKPREGIARYHVLTRNFEIYTEMDSLKVTPYEFGVLAEALRKKLEVFFETRGPKKRGLIEIARDKAGYERLAAMDKFEPNGGGRYMWHTKTVYMNGQWDADFTRGLFIHELTHQFHHQTRLDKPVKKRIGVGSGKARFIDEGLASFFERYHWDLKTEKLSVGVVNDRLVRDAKTFTAELSGLAEDKRSNFDYMLNSDKDYHHVALMMHYLVFEHARKTKALLSDPGVPQSAFKQIFRRNNLSPAITKDLQTWVSDIAEGKITSEFFSWRKLNVSRQ